MYENMTSALMKLQQFSKTLFLSLFLIPNIQSARIDLLTSAFLTTGDFWLLPILKKARSYESLAPVWRPQQNAKLMNNNPTKSAKPEPDEMLPEYDFSGGVRGKHAQALREGYSVTVYNMDSTSTVKEYLPQADLIKLEQDVQAFFPDSESVNSALRGLIALIPQRVQS